MKKYFTGQLIIHFNVVFHWGKKKKKLFFLKSYFVVVVVRVKKVKERYEMWLAKLNFGVIVLKWLWCVQETEPWNH